MQNKISADCFCFLSNAKLDWTRLTWTPLGMVHRGISCRSAFWHHEPGSLPSLGHQTVVGLHDPSSAEHLKANKNIVLHLHTALSALKYNLKGWNRMPPNMPKMLIWNIIQKITPDISLRMVQYCRLYENNLNTLYYLSYFFISPVIGKSTYRLVFPSKYSVPFTTTRWAGKLTPHAKVLVAINTWNAQMSIFIHLQVLYLF